MKDKEFDKDLKQAITAEHRKEQKDFLNSIEMSISIDRQSKSKFDWRIAASIALLIGLAGILYLINQRPSNEELYMSYFSPYENVVAPIVRDQNVLNKKEKAFALYEQEYYEKALESFNELSPIDSVDNSTTAFYKANSYLKLNEHSEAEELFKKVVDRNQKWKDESLWYLALISLKSNNEDTCIMYLEKLQKNSSVFSTQVSALLNELK